MDIFSLKTLIHPYKTLKQGLCVIYARSRFFHNLVDNNPKKAVDIMWFRTYQSNFPWDNPITLNEKITWLSVMTDTSLWTKYSDKYEVRKHIEDLGLGHILTKCYGVWEHFDDIDFSMLPDSFVLKCTHDCGSTILIHDKSTMNIEKTRRFIEDHQKVKMGYETCEPHYTRIKPRIMAEELLQATDKDGFTSHSLVDYKMWYINGNPEWAFVCYDRYLESEDTHSAVFDVFDLKEWKPIRQYLTDTYKHVTFKEVPRPENLDEMINVAGTIAQGFPQVRVDLYNVNGKIYFGEMTFTSQGGRMSYYTQEFQEMIGRKIILPNHL